MRVLLVYHFVFILCTSLPMSVVSLMKDVEPQREALAKLYDDLAEHRVFKNRLSPLPLVGANVSIRLLLYKINKIVEATQSLETGLFFLLLWHDESLAWREEDYGNTSEITLPSNLIWYPTLIYTNDADNSYNRLREPDYIRLHSSGRLVTEILSFTSTHCDFDFTYYPLDSHVCQVVLQTNGVDIFGDGTVADFMDMPEGEDIISYYVQNTEWTVTNKSIRTLRVSFGPHVFIELNLAITRSKLYPVLCILMPMMTTSVLTLLVFWIPPGSGEKMSYLVSIFMSMTLYINYSGETLPRNIGGNRTPRMTQLLSFVVLEVALAFAATVFVMRRHQAEQEASANTSKERSNKTAIDDIVVHQKNERRMSEDDTVHKNESNSEDACESKESGSMAMFCSRTLELFRGKLCEISTVKDERSLCTNKKLSARALDMIFFWTFLAVSLPFHALVFVI